LKRGETVPYNLAQAGAAVGKSKATILRAIRRGTISAQRDAVTGGWAIEPAELHRAFQPVANETAQNRDETGELRELRARAEAGEATIADLRRRLDESERERREQAARLAAAQDRIALLTDQRLARRRWWRWGSR
jgi:hypothetical protein